VSVTGTYQLEPVISVEMRGFLHVINVDRFNKIKKLTITDLIQERIFQNNHITTISHKSRLIRTFNY